MFRFLGKAILGIGSIACMFGGPATRRVGIELGKKVNKL